MDVNDQSTILSNTFWPSISTEPPVKWCDESKNSSAQDTSAAETTEVDEMSSEPFYINDVESLTGFFEHDPFPIQGGLEKLDLMDTSTSAMTVGGTAGGDVNEDAAFAAPASEYYERIEALMYGMNKMTINHKAALDMARQSPNDPVMIAVQALLHRDDNAANALWTKANQLGISSKVELGCGLVQALVGKMLEDGVGGVVKDSRRAEYWYTNSSKKGSSTAQYFLGLFHVKACEYDKARHWLERAARHGHARAQMHYGLLFEHGRVDQHGRRDYDKAIEWYRRASEQGDTKAACRLAFVVHRSNRQDNFLDLGYLTLDELMETTVLGDEPKHLQSSAKNTQYEPIKIGDPLFNNSQEVFYKYPLHYTGKQTVNSSGHVDDFSTTVADRGLVLPSQENEDVIAVKTLWLDQPGSSKKRRLENMVAVYGRIDSENNGSSAVASQVTVQNSGKSQDDASLSYVKPTDDPLFMHGSLKSIGPIDTEETTDHNYQVYDRVEALLYGMNKTKIDQHAALELARQYPNDPVMVCIQALLHREESAANSLWKRANELGISSRVELGGGLVQALVGKMLEDGFGGVKENLGRAEFFYTNSAKKGHATAQCFLGLFHVKDGEYDRARYWLEQAARKGHARAQMHFGLLFEHSRDFETAKFWYKTAASQGDRKAECRLDFVQGKRRTETSDTGYAKEMQQVLQSEDGPNPKQDTATLSSREYSGTILSSVPSPGFKTSDDRHSDVQKASVAAESLSAHPNSSWSSRQALGANVSLPFTGGSLARSHESRKETTKSLPNIGQQSWTKHEKSTKTSRVAKVSELSAEPDVIKPYCAVMGDKSTRGARLTTGTKVLREIKEWFKENRIAYQESGREALLFEEAMQRYFARMAELFDDFPTDRIEREQTLLVKCTKKSLESERVAKANCFRYPNENQCQYGTAKLPHAVLFYFDSRDPPKLDAEVTKYRRKLGARADLRGKGREYFESYLDFCVTTSSQAADGCALAQLAIESTNFIPVLKKLWDDLEKSSDG